MQGFSISFFSKICFLIFFTSLLSCGGGSGASLPNKDNVPPVITLISPTPGSKTESINPIIEINFDENINSVNTSNVLILVYSIDGIPDTAVDLSTSIFSVDNNKLRISNIPVLQTNSRYKITIKDIQDNSNNKMLTKCEWDFATSPYSSAIKTLSSDNCGSGPGTPDPNAIDNTAPKIVSTFPENAVVVEPTINITVKFDKAMDEKSLQTRILLQSISGGVINPKNVILDHYNFSYNLTTSEAIFTQKLVLSPQTDYQLSIKGGPDGVFTSPAGIELLADDIITFSTTSLPDTIKPKVISAIPIKDGIIEINKNIVITFSEPLLQSSLAGNFKFFEIINSIQSVELPAPFSISINPELTTVTLTPVIFSSKLLPLKNYRMIITSGNLGIFDTAGNSLLADFSVDFKTIVGSNQWAQVDGLQSSNASVYTGTNTYPGARSAAMTWKTQNGTIWIFGGVQRGTTGANEFLNELWKYNPSTQKWTEHSGHRTGNLNGNYGAVTNAPSSSIYPGGRIHSSAWVDGSGNLWLFGGQGFDSVATSVGVMNDLWKYTPISNQWTWVSGSQTAKSLGSYGTKGTSNANNQPPARQAAAEWLDNLGYLWLFGGMDDGTGSMNDVWKFDTFNKVWTWVNGSNLRRQGGVYTATTQTPVLPGSRGYSVYWRDSAGNFWTFGGLGEANVLNTSNRYGYLNDLWKYNSSTNIWTFEGGSTTSNTPGTYGQRLMPNANNIPGGRNVAQTWVDSTGNLWLLGGRGIDKNPGTFGDILHDLWKFDGTNWTWMHGTDSFNGRIDSSFPSASYNTVGWTDSGDNLWLFGGSSPTISNDLWLYTP